MDKWGPEKLLQAYQPSTGSLGLLVIDNTALGPGLGGLHFERQVSLERTISMARLYTLMNALHGVPYGGACACLAAREGWKADLREFASAISPLSSSFVAMPGGELGQEQMGLYAYAGGDVRSAAGKPSELKGIPFENGALGLGVAHCTLEALKFLRIEGARASVLGLGRDGLFAARLLERNGVKVVSAADSESGVINKDGLDIESLSNLVRNRGRLDAFSRGEGASVQKAVMQNSDIMLVFGSGFVNQDTPNDIAPKLLVEGSLGAVELSAESMFEGRGTTVLPDILACGGSSLSAHVERIGGNVVDMNEVVVNSMRRATLSVLERGGRSLREGAALVALSRIDEAAGRNRGEIREE